MITSWEIMIVEKFAWHLLNLSIRDVRLRKAYEEVSELVLQLDKEYVNGLTPPSHA